MTNTGYHFLSDIPLWIATPNYVFPSDALREMAKSLDIALLFHGECKEYLREALAGLRGFEGHVKEADYLQPLPDERLKELLAKPFSTRSVAELRAMHLEQLAMNPVAIDQLFEELAARTLSDEWAEILDEKIIEDSGIFELPQRPGDGSKTEKTTGVLNADSQSNPKEENELEMACAGRSLGERDLSKDQASADEEASSTPWPMTLHIQLSAEDPQIQWKSGGPRDAQSHQPGELVVKIVIEESFQLRVHAGGIAYVEPGCRLTLRWLSDELGTVNAEATLQDEDKEVLLDAKAGDAPKNWGPSHILEIRFDRTVSPEYSFVARVPIC